MFERYTSRARWAKPNGCSSLFTGDVIREWKCLYITTNMKIESILSQSIIASSCLARLLVAKFNCCIGCDVTILPDIALHKNREKLINKNHNQVARIQPSGSNRVIKSLLGCSLEGVNSIVQKSLCTLSIHCTYTAIMH